MAWATPVLGAAFLAMPGIAQRPPSMCIKTILEWDVNRSSLSSEAHCGSRVAESGNDEIVVLSDEKVLMVYDLADVKKGAVCLAEDVDWFGASVGGRCIGWLGDEGFVCLPSARRDAANERFGIPMTEAVALCVRLASHHEVIGDVMAAGGLGGVATLDLATRRSRLVWDEPCLDLCALNGIQWVLLGKPSDDILGQRAYVCVFDVAGRVIRRWSGVGFTSIAVFRESKIVVAGDRGVELYDARGSADGVLVWGNGSVSDLACVGDVLWMIAGGALYCVNLAMEKAVPVQVLDGFVHGRLAPLKAVSGVVLVSIKDRPREVGLDHLIRPMRESITVLY